MPGHAVSSPKSPANGQTYPSSTRIYLYKVLSVDSIKELYKFARVGTQPMKLQVQFIFICCALLGLLIAPWSYVEAAPPSIHTNAVGASLVDVGVRTFLYSEKGDTPMRIASLTKIMTAIIAIEQGD